MQAVYEWARSRDIPEEDIFVQEAMSRFLEGAEGSLDTATLETLAKQHLSTIWTWHAMKMTRYSELIGTVGAAESGSARRAG